MLEPAGANALEHVVSLRHETNARVDAQSREGCTNNEWVGCQDPDLAHAFSLGGK